jgi:5-methylthioadenosine/S-adenosylhomocysteine deaminase
MIGRGMDTRTADTMISHALVVTMDAERRVIADGAVAWNGDRIVAVGKTADLERTVVANETIDGRRFVLTPGLINSHIHITGEPLTRGFVPDNLSFEENVWKWVSPLHFFYTAEDERVSAQLAALEMLRTGTTCFLEAGTINHLDAVVDGLREVGIRARVGQRVSDLSTRPGKPAESTDVAISLLVDELARYPATPDTRISAWPVLIGHTICSDTLWQAAKLLSVKHGTGMSFHMSPAPGDVDWHVQKFGRRPVEHLADLGVLGRNVAITHLVHVDKSEIGLLAETDTSVVHCPTTALKVAYGVTQVGRFPEMAKAGINVAIGTDGNNASNYSDMMRATYLVAGLFKDARCDPTIFPAEQAFEMATLNGARALGLEHDVGSLEPGKKADIVLHDTDRPEWRPLLNVANQLVWSADGRGVHSVWVDGRRVVDNYRCTTIDEQRLYAEAQRTGEAIVKRSGLPDKAKWPRV